MNNILWSISRLGRRFGLSRSTLLYYHRIGLLAPSVISDKGYRLYTDEDAQRLAAICRYRDLGLPLDAIAELLDNPADEMDGLFQKQLNRLFSQANQIRRQQLALLSLLGKKAVLPAPVMMSKEQWVDLLRASGLSDEDMDQWHAAFEARSPESHYEFLLNLGLSVEEAQAIRKEAVENMKENTE